MMNKPYWVIGSSKGNVAARADMRVDSHCPARRFPEQEYLVFSHHHL